MLCGEQKEAFEFFAKTAHGNQALSEDARLMVALGVAMGIGCRHCLEFFRGAALEHGVSEEQMSAVEAIAMCVKAGSVRALVKEAGAEE